jgi:hypothetical protein
VVRRGLHLMVVMAFTMVMIGAGASAATAAQGFNETFHERHEVLVFEHFDFDSDDPSCAFLGTGTLTERENAIGHLRAAGIDEGDPNDPNDDLPIAPAHWDLNTTNHFTAVPDDASLPTFEGHSHTHVAWDADETGIGPAHLENVVVMTGSDGSQFTLHRLARAVFDLSELASPSEGIVDITFDHLRCGPIGGGN